MGWLDGKVALVAGGDIGSIERLRRVAEGRVNTVREHELDAMSSDGGRAAVGESLLLPAIDRFCTGTQDVQLIEMRFVLGRVGRDRCVVDCDGSEVLRGWRYK